VGIVFLHNRDLSTRFGLGYIDAREDGGFATCGLGWNGLDWVGRKDWVLGKGARGRNHDLHVFCAMGGGDTF